MTAVLDAVDRALRSYAADDRGTAGEAGARGVLLAVSGGCDSIVLLHAAARTARAAVRAVATFDHGTGAHAREALAIVRAAARALDTPLVEGAASAAGRSEAEWRDARWSFLQAVANARGAAAIATAHTRDDQLETVLMRAVRGAGARGLAAMTARSPRVIRPLLGVGRAEVAAYAEARALRWVEDPSNGDRRHLRARVRADLLPAIERARPGSAARLFGVAAAAARWRTEVDAWTTHASGRVAVSALDGISAAALAVFWPAFAARAGVRLDRRATARLVAYTPAVIGRIRDGTVQPAHVTVAGGAVELRHVAARPGTARTWTFVVQAAGVARGDVAASLASDYA
ncbi:MAG TPA: tRNA lysidine(34) synthetase TilS [Gemmatirosa sp.]